MLGSLQCGARRGANSFLTYRIRSPMSKTYFWYGKGSRYPWSVSQSTTFEKQDEYCQSHLPSINETTYTRWDCQGKRKETRGCQEGILWRKGIRVYDGRIHWKKREEICKCILHIVWVLLDGCGKWMCIFMDWRNAGNKHKKHMEKQTWHEFMILHLGKRS